MDEALMTSWGDGSGSIAGTLPRARVRKVRLHALECSPSLHPPFVDDAHQALRDAVYDFRPGASWSTFLLLLRE